MYTVHFACIEVKADFDRSFVGINADDIDTGVSDGSGVMNVRADSVEDIGNNKFRFNNVTIETDGDYSTWKDSQLKDQARDMLHQDYIDWTSEDEEDDISSAFDEDFDLSRQ